MRVIFLDYQGVLDTYENPDILDVENLNILLEIVKKTNAKIVITSSLRCTYFLYGEHNEIMQNLINILALNNVDVYGLTPLLDNKEKEITFYLNIHPEIESYCIFDDEYYFKSMKEHMVKLKLHKDKGNGLKDISLPNVIEKLNYKDNYKLLKRN